MKAVKLYNNNAASVVFEKMGEAVIVGSGIGFNKKAGDDIDESKIEKIYYIQDEYQTRFLEVIKDARPSVLQVSEDILKHARETGLEFKNQQLLSLVDHIDFAIDRTEKGIHLPNLMLHEIKMLYKEEFNIGKWALNRIKEVCNVRLPEDEAGYIAMQLVSSALNQDVAFHILEFVKGSCDIIKDTYGVELDANSIDTMRLTVHLKFLAKRIFNKEQWQNDDMEEMYNLLIARKRKNKECIERLAKYYLDTFDYTLVRQEKVYLMVHLNKIFS